MILNKLYGGILSLRIRIRRIGIDLPKPKSRPGVDDRLEECAAGWPARFQWSI
jgi:hypothetical protein